MNPEKKKRTLLVTGFVCVAALGLIVYLNSSPSDPLTDQAKYVAKALADNDANRLKSVAAEGTSDDVVKWLSKVRSKNGIQGDSSKYAISTAIMKGNPREGPVTVTASFVPLRIELSAEQIQDPRAGAFKSSAATPTTPDIAIDLEFVKDGRGYWRLDGRVSLAAAEPPVVKPPTGSR
jgi:hypothetical protein